MVHFSAIVATVRSFGLIEEKYPISLESVNARSRNVVMDLFFIVLALCYIFAVIRKLNRRIEQNMSIPRKRVSSPMSTAFLLFSFRFARSKIDNGDHSTRWNKGRLG